MGKIKITHTRRKPCLRRRPPSPPCLAHTSSTSRFLALMPPPLSLSLSILISAPPQHSRGRLVVVLVGIWCFFLERFTLLRAGCVLPLEGMLAARTENPNRSYSEASTYPCCLLFSCSPPTSTVRCVVRRSLQMVFIAGEGGGAGSRLTQDVGNILAQLPETVEALTGGISTRFPPHIIWKIVVCAMDEICAFFFST